MPRWYWVLLAFAPLALAARAMGWAPLVIFGASAISLIPLAGLIGLATEELAYHLGPRFGGLLNATFGNAAELIITVFAIQRGLLTLVKASITGSIIGNTLLVLGMALLAGGVRNGVQRYDPRETSHNSVMMILAIAGLILPATFAFVDNDLPVVENISLIVAGLLLVTYLAYLAYTITNTDVLEQEGAANEASWTRRKSLLVLAAATAGTAVVSEMLVGAVEPVTRQLGWSEFFVGVIIVPIVGNVAEHFAAVQFAWRNRMDLSLAIASGSSTQIAVLVAPVLVFLSLAMGKPMNLVFAPLELAILVLATAVFAYINIDGESNWLEGVQLLALYAMAGVVFFFLPNALG